LSAKIRNNLGPLWSRPIRGKSFLSFQPCMGFDIPPFLTVSFSSKELRHIWGAASLYQNAAGDNYAASR
jgi:hypothetical protein